MKEIHGTEGMSDEQRESTARITRLGNRGVRKAIERAHAAGLAVPFSKGGKIYFHWPDGTITDKRPEKYPQKAADSEGYGLMVAEKNQ
ncbi:MAG: hypothetical protein LBC59_03615 [Chitinispirillales bacterium]|jgi:hypothetical protein|nr:hypothetical protein [Chitinispirillales bacterium]